MRQGSQGREGSKEGFEMAESCAKTLILNIRNVPANCHSKLKTCHILQIIQTALFLQILWLCSTPAGSKTPRMPLSSQ